MTTKSIPATRLRYNLGAALDSLKKEDVLIITRRGEDEQAIISIDLLEDLLAANNPKYLKSIKEARASKKWLSHEDVFGEL